MSSSCAGGPKSGWRPRSGSASRSGLSEYGSNRSLRWRASPFDLVEHRRHRVDRPAARTAAHALDDERRVLELAGLLVQEPHAEVRRDRVEAAAVHDPRAALLRRRMAAVDRLADEERLAGQVDVVGPGRRRTPRPAACRTCGTGRPSWRRRGSVPRAPSSTRHRTSPRRSSASPCRGRPSRARASPPSGPPARPSHRPARASPGTPR